MHVHEHACIAFCSTEGEQYMLALSNSRLFILRYAKGLMVCILAGRGEFYGAGGSIQSQCDCGKLVPAHVL